MHTEFVTGLFCFALMGTASSQVHGQTDEIQVRKDVVYATHDGVSLTGDFYLPAAEGRRPAIMFIHGGGSKAAYGVMWGPYLAAHAYVVFSIDYRLSKPKEPTDDSWD